MIASRQKMTWANKEWPVIDSFMDKNGITNRVLVIHRGNRRMKRAYAMDMLRKSTSLLNNKQNAVKKVRAARKVLNVIQRFSRKVNTFIHSRTNFNYSGFRG